VNELLNALERKSDPKCGKSTAARHSMSQHTTPHSIVRSSSNRRRNPMKDFSCPSTKFNAANSCANGMACFAHRNSLTGCLLPRIAYSGGPIIPPPYA
jgi:hypothetical protein